MLYNYAFEKGVRAVARREGVSHFSTGVALFWRGRILLVRRALDDFMGGFYELPGGGVDAGESLGKAAVRELYEETGVAANGIVAVFRGFDYATDIKPKVRQFNFAVTADRVEVTLSPEHDRYLWVLPEDLKHIRLSQDMRQCLHEIWDSLRGVYS